MRNPFKRAEPNTGISVEVLPDKKILIKTSYNKRDDPAVLAITINSLFSNDPIMVDWVLGSLVFEGKKNGWKDEAVIVSQYIIHQQDLLKKQNNPKEKVGRIPLVSPDKVLDKLNHSITGSHR